MSFAEFLHDLQEAEAGPKILPEAAIARMREVAAKVASPNPFSVGDLVTPCAWASIKGAGDPHIVVEVGTLGRATNGNTEPGSVAYGAVLDMRVLSVSRDSVVAHWVESWMFEPYHPA